MEKVIAVAIPGLFIVGIVWLIIASNKRINNALSTASKTLGFTFINSLLIFCAFSGCLRGFELCHLID